LYLQSALHVILFRMLNMFSASYFPKYVLCAQYGCYFQVIIIIIIIAASTASWLLC